MRQHLPQHGEREVDPDPHGGGDDQLAAEPEPGQRALAGSGLVGQLGDVVTDDGDRAGQRGSLDLRAGPPVPAAAACRTLGTLGAPLVGRRLHGRLGSNCGSPRHRRRTGRPQAGDGRGRGLGHGGPGGLGGASAVLTAPLLGRAPVLRSATVLRCAAVLAFAAVLGRTAVLRSTAVLARALVALPTGLPLTLAAQIGLGARVLLAAQVALRARVLGPALGTLTRGQRPLERQVAGPPSVVAGVAGGRGVTGVGTALAGGPGVPGVPPPAGSPLCRGFRPGPAEDVGPGGAPP